jgi:hypothetical protein
MERAGALLRALACTAGRAAVQRALPLYLGLLLLASVLFEGSGVRPADVVAAARASRATLFDMYAAWTVVSLPALSALLGTPASFFLRSLPLARGRVLGLLAAGIGVAELPWFLLWLRGGGLGAGWAALASSVAIVTLLLTRRWRLPDLAGALLLGVTLFGPAPLGAARWPLVLLPSVVLAARGVFTVWLRAPEQAPFALRASVRGPPLVGLATTHALLLVRQSSAQLLRAGALLVLSLIYAVAALRSLRPASEVELVRWSLCMFVPALVFGVAGVAGPLLRAEAQLDWLLSASGTEVWTRRGALLGVVLGGAGGAALLHAVGVALTSSLELASPLRLLLQELASALALASLVIEVARWAVRADGHDSLRLIAALGALLAVAFVTLLALGLGAPALWLAMAFGVQLARSSHSVERAARQLARRLER